jgi:hypothetical protein
MSAAPPNEDEPGSVVLPGIEPVAGNVVIMLGREAEGSARSEGVLIADGGDVSTGASADAPGCLRKILGEGGTMAEGVSAAPPNDEEPGNAVLPGIEPVAGNSVTVPGGAAEGSGRSAGNTIAASGGSTVSAGDAGIRCTGAPAPATQ